MTTTEKSITVDGTFKLKIGETEISLTREEADRLYGELFKALGKQTSYYFNWSKPDAIPYYKPIYMELYRHDSPTYIEVTCKSGTNGNPARCNCTL